MTEAAKNVLVAFESLPVEDRREVAEEILRRMAVEADDKNPSKDLIRAADQVFWDVERDERGTQPEAIPPVSEEGLRRRRLAEVLQHAGRVELELDQEELRRLRETE